MNEKKRVVARLTGEQYFTKGNIVEWNNGLWIVSDITRKDGKFFGLDLIDLNSSNCGAGPNKNWGDLQSVKVVANCMEDFFKDKIENLFQW